MLEYMRQLLQMDSTGKNGRWKSILQKWFDSARGGLCVKRICQYHKVGYGVRQASDKPQKTRVIVGIGSLHQCGKYWMHMVCGNGSRTRAKARNGLDELVGLHRKSLSANVKAFSCFDVHVWQMQS